MTAEALVVIVGGARCALPMERVLEVRVYDGATRVPGAAPWMRGIVEREGAPVEVIDAAQRLHRERTSSEETAQRACVVFFDRAAMLVDDVDRLVSIDEIGCELIDVDAFFAVKEGA